MSTAIKLIGWLIIGVAVFYFAWRLAQVIPDIDFTKFGSSFFILLAVGIIFYTFALYLLAFGWAYLLAGACGRPIEMRNASNVYARSNVAKYIPGNVFHFVGRQLLGRQFGWPQAAVAMASFLETAMLAISAVTIILVYGVIWSNQIFVLIPSYILYLTVAGLVIAPWVLWRAIQRLPFITQRLQMLEFPRSISARRLAVIFFIYVVFFALTGVIMWLLVQGLGSGDWDFGTLGTIAVAYTAAWFLGTITPGASGGIGVREAALVFLLGGIIGEADAVTLAIAMRVLTISGDGFYFATSFLGPTPSFSSPDASAEEN